MGRVSPLRHRVVFVIAQGLRLELIRRSFGPLLGFGIILFIHPVLKGFKCPPNRFAKSAALQTLLCCRRKGRHQARCH
jgi:hypothetical protein